MIALQIAIATILQIFSMLFLYYTGKGNDKHKKIKNWYIVILSMGFTFIVAMIAGVSSSNLLGFIKMVMLFQIIFCAAVTDYKRRIIPNVLVMFGVIFRSICFLFEFIWYRSSLNDILIQDIMGLFAGAGVLFVVYLFAKHAIGLGDIKLFVVIGITCGFQLTYLVLFMSFLLAACYGIFLILFRKKQKNYEMAFAPFILIGYILSLFISIPS